MFRLLVKLALAAAVVVAVWTWVPVHGRTMAERWKAAGSPGTFVDRTWAELAGERDTARPIPRREAGVPGAVRPREGHTEADRRALERILSDRLDEPPARR